MTKRDIFAELTEGFDALKEQRTNPCTLESWEQGRAKPNAQAALIMRLVEKFPDTVQRLATV